MRRRASVPAPAHADHVDLSANRSRRPSCTTCRRHLRNPRTRRSAVVCHIDPTRPVRPAVSRSNAATGPTEGSRVVERGPGPMVAATSTVGDTRAIVGPRASIRSHDAPRRPREPIAIAQRGRLEPRVAFARLGPSEIGPPGRIPHRTPHVCRTHTGRRTCPSCTRAFPANAEHTESDDDETRAAATCTPAATRMMRPYVDLESWVRANGRAHAPAWWHGRGLGGPSRRPRRRRRPSGSVTGFSPHFPTVSARNTPVRIPSTTCTSNRRTTSPSCTSPTVQKSWNGSAVASTCTGASCPHTNG